MTSVRAEGDHDDASATPLIGVPSTMRDEARPGYAAVAVIIAATAVTFSGTLWNTFLPLGFDDGLILQTPAIRALTWHNIGSLATAFNRVNFIPVTMLSFALHYQAWGFNPFGYHLTNVLLHALAALLVYLFLCRLVSRERTALLGALIFALHPVHMEAVSLAVEQKTLLSGVFCLVALIAYQRWRLGASRSYYAASYLAFVVAALSKAMAVSLPLLLMLYDYAFVDRRVRWLDKIPFFAVGCAVSAAALAGHAHEAAVRGPHGGTLLAHVLIVSRVTLEYVTSLFLPLNLSPIYYYRWAMLYSPLNVLAVAVIVFVCGCVTWQRRRYRWSFFCLWWFVLALLPESNVVPLAQLRADRYLYLPSIAFALWVAVGFARLPQSLTLRQWRCPTAAVSAAVVLLLAVLTYPAAAVWHDDVSAWARVVERHPWCAVAHGELGVAYYEREDYAQAERAFRQALSIAPVPRAYLYLAKMYAAHGFKDRATAQLDQFLALVPDDVEGRQLQAALSVAGES